MKLLHQFSALRSGLKARNTLAWGNAPGPSPCVDGGLKARITLAWGNAPGLYPPIVCGLKARTKSPHLHKLHSPGIACFAFASSATAQTVTIQIQFLKGRTSQPLKNLAVVINLNSSTDRRALGTLILHTDKNGVLSVKAPPGAIVRANPERSFAMSGQTNHPEAATHEISKVIRDGIAEENHCGHAQFLAPQPGVLVVGYRRETFIEALGDN